MASLEWLDLKACTSLEYFPRVVGKMDALRRISITRTAIKELPPSIGNLLGLRYLHMHSCRSLGELPTSLFKMRNLQMLDFGGVHPHNRKSWMKLMQDIQISSCYVKKLHLVNCGLLDEELHLILNCFRNLQGLYMQRNDFVSLPKCIKQCKSLWWLDVRDCKRLRDIPELPSELHDIDAGNCTSLTAGSLDNLYSQAKMELLHLRISVPVTTFPDWFNYYGEGDTLSFRVRGNLLPRGIVAFEATGKANMSFEQSFPVFMSINGHTDKLRIAAQEGNLLLFDGFVQLTEAEQKRLNKYMGLDWNDVNIQVMIPSPDMFLVKWGVYFYKGANMENVQFNKSSHNASTPSLLEQTGMTSLPNYEPPKKLLRTN
ncbi:disease resistance protein RPP2B-like [Neltuma alba]|uniref:disease resistance protein RPP2B-like n=1 Tax=Neltuma alba TaxID=207710 RepID=UPI0010A44255|nr:disease resistance protein RPP2B-like [Prosopis alba]